MNYSCSLRLRLLKLTRKAIKTKITTSGKEILTNLLLLLNYIGHTNLKCNHSSNVAMHVTPTLKGYKHQMEAT